MFEGVTEVCSRRPGPVPSVSRFYSPIAITWSRY